MPRPGLLAGALVGALLSAALVAILYFASHLAGLPFIPFNVFDWTARVLPGAVITFGIDAMVTVIRALDIGPTSEVAKLAEQTMAIAGLAVTGVAAGIVLFAVMRKRDAARAAEPTHQLITLACISNRIAGDLTSTTRWTGVSLGRLLQDVGLRSEATHFRIRSVDDFDEVVALDVVRADPRLMLTYAWDGVPLPRQHGFPLRIYMPDRYGMKQPKWIESIEAIDQWEPGYWVRRGWDRDALMRATSVIDTIGVDMMIIQADPQSMTVPIGGIAHAGARGISRVEVRMDDGPWQPALLREPLSDTTWVIWRYDWPFRPGNHTFTVRCFERDGTPQIETPSSVRPSGATGLHSLGEVF